MDAESGERLTVTPAGGGCDGPEPTTPPQPRNKETSSNAGRQ
jgi:hypothetical protein